MQPSRDDFVIAIRSAFLSKSAQQRFSLLLLIFFSLILISLSKFNFQAIDYVRMSFKEIAYRSSFIVSIPEKYIKIGYYSFKDHLQLYQDYEKTKLELEILKSCSFLYEENLATLIALRGSSLKASEVFRKIFFAISFDPL